MEPVLIVYHAMELYGSNKLHVKQEFQLQQIQTPMFTLNTQLPNFNFVLPQLNRLLNKL